MKKNKTRISPPHRRFLVLIVLLFLIMGTVAAVLVGTRMLPKANVTQTIVSLDAMQSAQHALEDIHKAILEGKPFSLTEESANAVIAYLTPKGKMINSVRIATTNNNTVTALAKITWPMDIEVQTYAVIALDTGIPQADVKEVALYGIPMPKFLWEHAANTVNGLVKKNFIKYNARLKELSINEEGITSQGSVPQIFLDPAFWQKQNNRAERYAGKMKLPF